ncbi:hypothetical protein GCM10010249_51470 [Streptomyces roseolilacinus]|uniref:Uncharacterized protein n=2 Tax=Streptomyces roseolilacinus TaxID=66904 RepID=A0A918B497_9ACTN|nr:hypothetical protein GCM10010249_51470 [Streptomyces roseolilacinus]
MGVVAVTLSGCVSVAPGSVPAEPPAAGAPTRAPVPQVAEARPREALESAAPAPAPPPRPAAARQRTDEASGKSAGARPRPRATVRPAAPAPTPASAPVPARSAAAVPDVCGLVERHSAWRLGGAGGRTCREATRR